MTHTGKLPDSAMPIMRYLDEHGKKTQRELIVELKMTTRTVRYALRRLLKRGMIKEYPNLSNMRSHYYKIEQWTVNEILNKEDHTCASVFCNRDLRKVYGGMSTMGKKYCSTKCVPMTSYDADIIKGGSK